jgi:hypothetical protein
VYDPAGWLYSSTIPRGEFWKLIHPDTPDPVGDATTWRNARDAVVASLHGDQKRPCAEDGVLYAMESSLNSGVTDANQCEVTFQMSRVLLY